MRSGTPRSRLPVWIFNRSFPQTIMPNNSQTSKKPVKVIRLKGLSASVFENSSEDSKSPFFKVSLQRTYKQGDEFKTTTSLSRDDLPIAVLLLNRAWEFILGEESRGSNRD